MPDKVTAGEWVVDDVNTHLLAVKVEGIYHYVASSEPWDFSETERPNEEVEANARLMAASKKMYRMLDRIANSIGKRDDWHKLWGEIDIRDLLREIDVEVD